jgi:choline monooxygenase
MLNIYPDNIQVNIIVPLTHEKTLTIFEWYFHDADSEKTRKRAAKAITFSDTVQAEDAHLRGRSARARINHLRPRPLFRQT